MRITMKRRGQSTLEYAVIIAVVVAALLAMQIYMKRGVEGKLRDSTDQIGDQFDAETTSFDSTTSRTSKTVQITTGGATTSLTGAALPGGAVIEGFPETRTETGSETVGAW